MPILMTGTNERGLVAVIIYTGLVVAIGFGRARLKKRKPSAAYILDFVFLFFVITLAIAACALVMSGYFSGNLRD